MGVAHQEQRRQHHQQAQQEARKRDQAQVLLHLHQKRLVEDHLADAVPRAELGHEHLEAVRVGIRRLDVNTDRGRQKRLVHENLSAFAELSLEDLRRLFFGDVLGIGHTRHDCRPRVDRLGDGVFDVCDSQLRGRTEFSTEQCAHVGDRRRAEKATGADRELRSNSNLIEPKARSGGDRRGSLRASATGSR